MFDTKLINPINQIKVPQWFIDEFYGIKYKVLQMNPLGTRKKSEPQMGFEPTTLRDLVRML